VTRPKNCRSRANKWKRTKEREAYRRFYTTEQGTTEKGTAKERCAIWII